MTQDRAFNIQSIAIIGSGAAGLTTLFELLHTKQDGSTTIKYLQNGDVDLSKLVNDDPAFPKIVVFEQASKIGGIWSPSFENPDVIPQKAFDTENYNDPYVLNPRKKVPKELKEKEYDFADPFLVEEKHLNGKPKWTSSGIYRHLFSNVPDRFLRNSFMPLRTTGKKASESENILKPLITNHQITNRLLDFAQKFSLTDHIRVNSEVINVHRRSDESRWEVTIKQTYPNNNTVKWYTEKFDAVIVSNGHYSVPYIPKIQGLSSWNAQNTGSVIHSKSFRDPQMFKDKVCLFVGTGLSGIDILQYAFPIAKSVIVSRTAGKEEIYEWLTKAATSDGIIVKPRIIELKPQDGRTVVFEDGTTIDSVDHIIFSTGYHWHYPFLNSEETDVSVLSPREKSIPDGSSMVAGLYLNTFAIKQPSLAFVGVTITPFKWPSFELTASAIAGAWTNKVKIPDKKTQTEYSARRVSETGKSIMYHYYPAENFSQFVEELVNYLPHGRNAKDIYDARHLDDMKAAGASAERLFYLLKDGHIEVRDTL